MMESKQKETSIKVRISLHHALLGLTIVLLLFAVVQTVQISALKADSKEGVSAAASTKDVQYVSSKQVAQSASPPTMVGGC